MSLRRQARQVALQLLYQDDLNPQVEPAAVAKFLRSSLKRKAAAMEFALSLLDGVREHRAELDPLLAAKAENWTLDRMAVVDRNILRLAVFEFLHETETPTTVVINEALEIARKFSTEESTQFINGILDAINKNYLPTVQS